MTSLDNIELAGLSEAEIAELSEFIDPDNELLPASDRMPSHTKKTATGPYDRKHLLNHLSDQAEKSTVGNDYIPFVKKQPSKDTKPKNSEPAKKQHQKTEFDDVLCMLDQEDLEELAAELGLHSFIDQATSRGDEKPVANPSFGLNKPTTYSSTVQNRINSYSASTGVGSPQKASLPRRTISSDGSKSLTTPLQLPGMRTEKGASKYEGEVPQDTNVEDVIQRLKDDDDSLIEVNLNNHGGLDAELMAELIEALKDNTYLEKLLLSNVKLDEGQAIELASALKINCTLRVLNLESNRITRKGIKAIMKALADNDDTVLKELRMVNQYFAGGAGAEGEIARYLVKNTTITKLGYNFTVPSFRTKVDCLIMRNVDFERKRRTALND